MGPTLACSRCRVGLGVGEGGRWRFITWALIATSIWKPCRRSGPRLSWSGGRAAMPSHGGKLANCTARRTELKGSIQDWYSGWNKERV
ncbi:hypothetical protein IF1G_01735 [Cordyceps javanica]|uniref:Uncharacterized protein n=1 Tax=Cordyceps javanica TaxID=43265 RepID=A0A545VCT4_9HYPO|nr:hypothetical protein IF1G_01735 [Cordyceps javanica]